MIELIAYINVFIHICAIFSIYTLYTKYKELLSLFHNEKKGIHKIISNINTKIKTDFETSNNKIKELKINLDALITSSNKTNRDIVNNLTNLSKKCSENKTIIEVMKSSNFDLNINIDYLKENNIVELIDLLKKNKLPEIVTLSISSLKNEIVNDMTSNISSTFSSLKDEMTSNISSTFLSLKDEINTKFTTYTVTDNKIIDEINQLSEVSKSINNKILSYNDFINSSISENNKKFNKKISDVRYKYNILQRDIDTYLDKTYMIVGFHSGTVIPNVILRTNEYGSAPMRKEVADYWNLQPSYQVVN